MLPWEHPEKLPPGRGISAAGRFPATQKQEAKQGLLPTHTHYSRTGQWLKKMTSWHPPSSDPSHAPASRDASMPLRLWQVMPHMSWLPYLEEAPQAMWFQHWVDRSPVSGHWEMSLSLNTGEIQSWHSSCFLRNNELLAAGKTLVWCLPDFQSFLGLYHPWLGFCKNENIRTEERCHCFPNPPTPGVGWVWTQSIVPHHTITLPANLPTCHECRSLLAVPSNQHTPSARVPHCLLSPPLTRAMQH